MWICLQNSVCVAVDNGDILKCDVEDNYQEGMSGQQTEGQGGPITVFQETPKVYKPKVSL